MRNEYSKEELKNLIDNAKYISVDIAEYNIGDNRDSYFNTVNNIYDDMMANIDDINFFQDKVDMIRENHSYNLHSSLSEIFNCTENFELEDIFGYDEIQDAIDENNSKDDCEFFLNNLEDIKLSEVEEKYPEFYKNVIETLDELTDDDINVYNDGSTIFDCNYIYEVINNETFEALAYWTAYFNPDYEDKDIALEIGLVPFEYEDTFYLAFGGCGMDLSPKLDAYVALTYGVIPKNSQYFRDTDYFKYVVGDRVYNKIEKKCKLANPKYTLSFTLNTEEE